MFDYRFWPDMQTNKSGKLILFSSLSQVWKALENPLEARRRLRLLA